MNRPFYAEYAWAYDLLIQGPVASRVDFVVDQLHRRGILPGAHLLDAGCGTGSYSIALAERGFTVTGLDAAGEMIAEARRKTGGAAGRTCFLVGDILSLPAGFQVDAILCRGVLNDLIDEDCRRLIFTSFGNAMRQGRVLILDVREWYATLIRKTVAPVFEKTLETERGLLTFRSVTTLQAEKQCLLISETHLLESRSSCRQSAEYDFVMRCWTQDEVSEGLTAAGFESVQCFGDYDSVKPVGATDRFVAVATMGKYKRGKTNQPIT